jgi:hypothetical protein
MLDSRRSDALALEPERRAKQSPARRDPCDDEGEVLLRITCSDPRCDCTPTRCRGKAPATWMQERGRGCATACGNIGTPKSCPLEASPVAGHSHTTPTGSDAGSGHAQKSCRTSITSPPATPCDTGPRGSRCPSRGAATRGGGARLLTGRGETVQLRDQLRTERPWRSDAAGEAIDGAVRDGVAPLQPNADRDAAIAAIRELRHDF